MAACAAFWACSWLMPVFCTMTLMSSFISEVYRSCDKLKSRNAEIGNQKSELRVTSQRDAEIRIAECGIRNGGGRGQKSEGRIRQIAEMPNAEWEGGRSER